MNTIASQEAVLEKAETLDTICSRLSGGFYQRIDFREQDWHPLLPLHGLSWAVSQGLKPKKSSGLLDKVRHFRRNGTRNGANPGGVHKPFRISQDTSIIPFSGENMDYASSDFAKATEFDPITVYSNFLSQAAKFIGRETLVPVTEHNPLLATAFYIVLSRVPPYLERTNFRRESTEAGWPTSEATAVITREFMSDLATLIQFPLEQFVRDYADLAGHGALTRQIPPSRIDLNAEPGKWNEGEFSVDEMQYEKVTKLRDHLVEIMRSETNLGTDEFLETLANYYFESNPWNYMTFFEAEIEFNSVVKITPSKRREVDVYVDHTGHLNTVRNWMGQLIEGNSVPHLALDGPPGTGKTSALIKAAEDYNVKVISIDLETAARGLPSLIRQIRPMRNHAFVVYIDNVDASKFNSEDAHYRQYFFQIVNGLERNVEGAASIGNKVRFAMSTSTYDALPLPLRQRFSQRLNFSVPSIETAIEITAAYMSENGINEETESVMRTIYDVEDLADVPEDKLLTPRQIRDGVQSYAFTRAIAKAAK